ncbi:di-trans,poly-cis-decaprenylcistransferase [Candidatus Woesebacteria bacterium]|nr:di-trans,poly-cis-decaprenylcistransferase [Candidatus Woesebacteria bacterium]
MAHKYKIQLPSDTKVPDHLAIIPDGNRRWARARGLHTLEGHRVGFNRGLEVGRAARAVGIHTVTLWGFSTENWDRTEEEINYLMKLYKKLVNDYLKDAIKEGIKIVHLGKKDKIPKFLLEKIVEAEEKTCNNDKYIANIAIDYGGHDDILRAVKRIISDRVDPNKINEKVLSQYLDTHSQPYPYVDLMIRTSGEQRTSGLLLWQSAYAEYYWENDHFPDFTPQKLEAAILDYSRRRRRFGGNDAVVHFNFKPEVVAKLELGWRHALAMGEGEKFRDLVIRYVKEHYGLSKELAKVAGLNLSQALIHGKSQNWEEAKKALISLYGIVKKTLGLAFEPDLVAGIEVNLWRNNGEAEKTENGLKLEETLRTLYAETFRISDLQVTKAAHLSALATAERDLAEKESGPEAHRHWKRAHWYTELFYRALKDRIA